MLCHNASPHKLSLKGPLKEKKKGGGDQAGPVSERSFCSQRHTLAAGGIGVAHLTFLEISIQTQDFDLKRSVVVFSQLGAEVWSPRHLAILYSLAPHGALKLGPAAGALGGERQRLGVPDPGKGWLLPAGLVGTVGTSLCPCSKNLPRRLWAQSLPLLWPTLACRSTVPHTIGGQTLETESWLVGPDPWSQAVPGSVCESEIRMLPETLGHQPSSLPVLNGGW